jgi:hypothetical protein
LVPVQQRQTAQVICQPERQRVQDGAPWRLAARNLSDVKIGRIGMNDGMYPAAIALLRKIQGEIELFG